MSVVRVVPKKRKTLSENCTIKWKLDCYGNHALSFLERLGLLYSALFYAFSIHSLIWRKKDQGWGSDFQKMGCRISEKQCVNIFKIPQRI